MSSHKLLILFCDSSSEFQYSVLAFIYWPLIFQGSSIELSEVSEFDTTIQTLSKTSGKMAVESIMSSLIIFSKRKPDYAYSFWVYERNSWKLRCWKRLTDTKTKRFKLKTTWRWAKTSATLTRVSSPSIQHERLFPLPSSPNTYR